VLVSHAAGRARRVVYWQSFEIDGLLTEVVENRMDVSEATRRILEMASRP
jgi:hypothetical protein